jgi:non-heme chloroperoxidase
MTTVAQPGRAGTEPVAIHTITGAGGVRLHVREWGDREALPILFLHGLSQTHQCWQRQYGSRLAADHRLIACDLRGHGMSDAPQDPGLYADGRLWADDLDAILDFLGLASVVVVGWSYGPFVICDYVRRHGSGRIAGIVSVGGATRLGPAAFGTFIGPGFLDNFADLVADDLPANIQGIRGLVHAFTSSVLPADDVETLLCASMTASSRVRAALGSRELDCDDVLAELRVPLLVSHGRADTVVLPAMAEHVLDTCPTAEPSWYDDAAHVPFLEEPDRFNRELAAFAARVQG